MKKLLRKKIRKSAIESEISIVKIFLWLTLYERQSKIGVAACGIEAINRHRRKSKRGGMSSVKKLKKTRRPGGGCRRNGMSKLSRMSFIHGIGSSKKAERNDWLAWAKSSSSRPASGIS
jgi:hypothetical protein